MLCTRSMRLLAALVAVAAVTCPTSVFADWQEQSSSTQTGPGTIYGKGQNSKGACSYGTNFADTTGLPWSSPPKGASDGGTGYPMTFIAMNAPQFALTASCGTCVWFRGTGPGIGVESRKISSEWQYGFVDNICPECKTGALDLARNFDVGDGIWTIEWHAVPCNVGDTKLYYSFTAADQYYFNLVISNTRVPVADVSAVIEGKRIPLTRSTNNNWAYHNSDGAYTFPMEVTITPVCGKAVTDTIDDVKGGYGGVQFGEAGCSSLGDPTSGGGGGGGSSGSSGDDSSSDSSSSGDGEVSTEATSVQRAETPAPRRHKNTNKTPDSTSVQRAETPAPTRRHRNVKKTLDSQARLLIPTDSPTDAPTNAPTDAPTDAPTSKPTSAPTDAPTDAPTSAPKAKPAAEPTSAPTSQPTADPTAAPTDAPTDAPTATPTAEPKSEARLIATEAPTETPTPGPTPDVVAFTRTDAAAVRDSKPSGGERNMYGGTLSNATDKSVLPPWYQCGDNSGMYPGIDCGGADWNCVMVNGFYWQCRNDDGGSGASAGRRLAAVPRRSLRH